MAGPGEAQFWDNMWDKGQRLFHKNNIHPWLKENLHHLTGERQNLKIFVPLCGKSVDMKWLAELGHTVVGVEVAKQAVDEFFQDESHGIETLTQIKGKLYKNKDGSIRLYNCDIFDFNSDFEGKFDAIWDRASVVALPHNLTERYVKLMITLMKPDYRYILESLDYDQSEMPGPPHSLPQDILQSYFEPKCKFERLFYDETVKIFKSLSRFTVSVYKITLK